MLTTETVRLTSFTIITAIVIDTSFISAAFTMLFAFITGCTPGVLITACGGIYHMHTTATVLITGITFTTGFGVIGALVALPIPIFTTDTWTLSTVNTTFALVFWFTAPAVARTCTAFTTQAPSAAIVLAIITFTSAVLTACTSNGMLTANAWIKTASFTFAFAGFAIEAFTAAAGFAFTVAITWATGTAYAFPVGWMQTASTRTIRTAFYYAVSAARVSRANYTLVLATTNASKSEERIWIVIPCSIGHSPNTRKIPSDIDTIFGYFGRKRHLCVSSSFRGTRACYGSATDWLPTDGITTCCNRSKIVCSAKSCGAGR